MNTDKLNFTFPSKTKMLSFALMAVGLVCIIMMFMMDKGNEEEHYHAGTRAWSNVFVGAFFFTALSLAAAFFLGLQYAAESGWSTTIKRVIEAVTAYLKWGLASFFCCSFSVRCMFITSIIGWLMEWLLPDMQITMR